MKLEFSWSAWADRLLGVARRFPVTSLLTLLGVVTGLIVVGNFNNELAVRVLLTAILFFPISVGLRQMEDQHYPGWVKFVGNIGGLLLLSIFFLVFSKYKEFDLGYLTRYILWFGLGVVFATVSPFFSRLSQDSLSYWRYIKHIVYAFVTAFAYSAIIFIGLAIALAATNELFNLYWQGEVWLRLWVLCVGLLSVPIFLSKFPQVSEVLENEEFPKELRLFGGGVMLSLVLVYFVILYAYTFKIVALNEWPKGSVSSLIVGFSTIGFITFILLYPLTKLETKYKKISTVLFTSFIPQIIVLFYAVSLRLADYGLTENRYLLISFGIWLGVISLYFLFSKTKSLKIIPYSLVLLLVLATVGPVNAFKLSEMNQVNRLKAILISKDALVNDSLVKGPHGFSVEESGRVYSILRYLKSYHGLSSIGSYLPEDVPASNDSRCRRDAGCYDVDQISEFIGVGYVPGGLDSNYVSFNVIRENSRVLDIRGYDTLIEDAGEVTVGNDLYSFNLDRSTNAYQVLKNGSAISTVKLQDLIDKLKKSDYQKIQKGFSEEEMSITYSDAKVDIKIYFDYITLLDGRLEVKDWKLVKVK